MGTRSAKLGDDSLLQNNIINGILESPANFQQLSQIINSRINSFNAQSKKHDKSEEQKASPIEDLAEFQDFHYFNRNTGQLLLITKDSAIEIDLKSEVIFPQESAVGYLAFKDIIAVGGVLNSNLTDSVFLISPSTQEVKKVAQLPKPCKQGQVHGYKNWVYYIGGLCEGENGLTQASLMRYNITQNLWQDLFRYGQDYKFNKIVNMGTCILGNKLLLVGGQRINSHKTLAGNKKIYSIDIERGFKVQIEGKLPQKILRPAMAAGSKQGIITGGISLNSNTLNRKSFRIGIKDDICSIVPIDDIGIDLFELYPSYYCSKYAIFISFPNVAIRMKSLTYWLGYQVTGKTSRLKLEFTKINPDKNESFSSIQSELIGEPPKKKLDEARSKKNSGLQKKKTPVDIEKKDIVEEHKGPISSPKLHLSEKKLVSKSLVKENIPYSLGKNALVEEHKDSISSPKPDCYGKSSASKILDKENTQNGIEKNDHVEEHKTSVLSPKQESSNKSLDFKTLDKENISDCLEKNEPVDDNKASVSRSSSPKPRSSEKSLDSKHLNEKNAPDSIGKDAQVDEKPPISKPSSPKPYSSEESSVSTPLNEENTPDSIEKDAPVEVKTPVSKSSSPKSHSSKNSSISMPSNEENILDNLENKASISKSSSSKSNSFKGIKDNKSNSHSHSSSYSNKYDEESSVSSSSSPKIEPTSNLLIEKEEYHSSNSNEKDPEEKEELHLSNNDVKNLEEKEEYLLSNSNEKDLEEKQKSHSSNSSEKDLKAKEESYSSDSSEKDLNEKEVEIKSQSLDSSNDDFSNKDHEILEQNEIKDIIPTPQPKIPEIFPEEKITTNNDKELESSSESNSSNDIIEPDKLSKTSKKRLSSRKSSSPEPLEAQSKPKKIQEPKKDVNSYDKNVEKNDGEKNTKLKIFEIPKRTEHSKVTQEPSNSKSLEPKDRKHSNLALGSVKPIKNPKIAEIHATNNKKANPGRDFQYFSNQASPVFLTDTIVPIRKFSISPTEKPKNLQLNIETPADFHFKAVDSTKKLNNPSQHPKNKNSDSSKPASNKDTISRASKPIPSCFADSPYLQPPFKIPKHNEILKSKLKLPRLKSLNRLNNKLLDHIIFPKGYLSSDNIHKARLDDFHRIKTENYQEVFDDYHRMRSENYQAVFNRPIPKSHVCFKLQTETSLFKPLVDKK